MEGKKIAAYAAGALVCVAAGMAAEHYGNVITKTQNYFSKKGKEEEVASPAQAQAQVQNQEPVVAKPQQQNQNQQQKA